VRFIFPSKFVFHSQNTQIKLET